MIKKLILTCVLLPLIASCAGKAADYGLSEEQFNTKSNQFLSICEGQMGKCNKIFPKVITFRDFLSNYDRYNKYPVDILRIALSNTGTNGNYTENNNNFWHEVEKTLRERPEIAEKKIAEEKRIASQKKAAEEEAEEMARISKKYNKPWCDQSFIQHYISWSSSQRNCLLTMKSPYYTNYIGEDLNQPYDGTGTLIAFRLGSSTSDSMVCFIERNNFDSPLSEGIFEPSTGLYRYFPRFGKVEMVMKFKRLQ
jgi:hypothetical protein